MGAVDAIRMSSTFGVQAYSHRPSSPSFGFGSASRADMQKLFAGKDHTLVTHISPGARYDMKGSVGQQVESTRSSSPQWRVGTASRWVSAPSTSPGPARYDSRRSAVGPQQTSNNRSSPLFGFGSSTRDHQDKLYVSKSHERVKFGLGSPGPCTAAHSLEVGGRKSGFGTADRFNTASKCGLSPPVSPGPAAYDNCGVPAVSSYAGAPSYGFGSSNRANRTKVYLSPEHSRADCGSLAASPGPAFINNARSSLGRQLDSRSAPTWAFGTAERFGASTPKYDSPGPGAYSP
mmetsp:Transcript_23331/g.68066  ORF Transcript_23331/g.68066 Transcript_23331/m.68066 type:complete len:290 (-) Transcript_23331:55-924(-)